MDNRKLVVDFAESQGLAPVADATGMPFTPVIVVAGNPWGEERLRRRFPTRQGFLLIEREAAGILAQCRRMAPCVLVADLELIERTDQKTFASIADFGRAVQVLVFSKAADDDAIRSLLRIGCMGFIPETAPVSVLQKAVKAVSSGQMWVERRLLTSMLRELLSLRKSPKLSSRESEVLRLIAQGHKNRVIAQRLSITHDTVRWHIRSLNAKLGVKDRNGMTLWAQHNLRELAPEGNDSKPEPSVNTLPSSW